MRFVTVCSGIGAPETAWTPLGWEPVFCSDIEKFPNAVMAHHHPDLPNYGDMTKYEEWPDHESIGLICGGTPCQSFSVAGLRGGLDDERGNLALVFCGLVSRYRPEWVLWENVPGVLSSSGGADFAAFLDGMAHFGYFGAYRVLDAQWFGVAQRRRRVFALFHLGDWRPAAAVLFESESLRGNPAPSREARERVAADTSPCLASGKQTVGTLMANAETKLWLENQEAFSGDYFVCATGDKTHPPTARCDSSEDGCGRGTPIVPIAFKPGQDAYTGRVIPVTSNPGQGFGLDYECNAHSLDAPTGPILKGSPTGGGHMLPAVAFTQNDAARDATTEPAPTQRSGSSGGGNVDVATNTRVRRLTPTECERLQGFPDNYTQIPWRNKPAEECPDGPRYKALGNSMAVPVLRWIGERIQRYEELA